MSILIIAEKPSMGMEIAKGLARGPIQRGKNQVMFNGPDGATVLSWCIGHLLEMFYPEDYDAKFKKWSLDTLPIVPRTIQMKPAKDKAAQLKTLEGLLKKARTVVHAGDAGREGQLIVDEVLKFFGYRGEVKRLWVKDLVPAAVKKAYQEMQPNSTKKALCDAAEARQIADWLVGMNMSRAYTIQAGNKLGRNDLLLKYGRVQTPTLRLLVDRTIIRENFTPVDYFVPKISITKSGQKVIATWMKENDTSLLKTDPSNRLIDRNQAQNLLTAAGDIAQVVDFKENMVEQLAPKPFTLSALQKECSSKLKLTAKKTLELAQKLYEAGLISYPRTDCAYMPMSKLEEAPNILRGLAQYQNFLAAVKDCNLSTPSKMFNDEKTGEHWAIIPTSNTQGYKDLPEDQKAIYDLVARNYMAQLHPTRVSRSRKVVFATARGHYDATSSVPIREGWKAHFSDKEGEGTTNSLPSFTKGERFRIEEKALSVDKTSPPECFTEGTIVEAMEGVHKYVTNPEIKKKLRETDGIGTQATRADIIETLLQAGYIERQKKVQLHATPFGIAYIRSLPAPVTDPGLTALWERALTDVSEGKQQGAQFIKQIEAWLDNALLAASRLDYAALAKVEKAAPKKNNTRVKDSQVEAWLTVPYGEESKRAGELKARFCGKSKRWYVPKGRSTEPFKQWM